MIPDTSPMHMARALVVRHADVGFVRSYILSHFGTAPTREKIAALRDEFAARVARARGNAPMSDEARCQARRRRDMEKRASKRYRAKGRAA